MIEEETDFLHHLLGHLAQRGSSLEPEPPWFPTSIYGSTHTAHSFISAAFSIIDFESPRHTYTRLLSCRHKSPRFERTVPLLSNS